MNIKLTLGERLKDLRVERNLKLETLAEQTGLSKSALSKYESDDVTDLSIYAVTTLAEFYGVTTDYLLGVTENKKRPDAVLSDLHLSDGAVDVLRNGKFNHRLLCELIVHENFRRFMTDLEIYVDGYVSANIQNLNAGLEATRQMLKKKYAADENDLYMSTLKLGQIDEDEYFGRVLYDELVAILKNIKTEHRKDKTTSDGAMVDNLMKELEDAQKLEGSADEKKIRTALKAIGINYDKLTEDERKLIKKILYDELAAILKQIKAAHGNDKTTSDGAAIEQARKQLEDAQKFEGSPLEKKMNVLMGQIGIDYSKLTKEEQMTLLRVFNKSSMLKHRTKAGMRGKYRR